MTEPLTKVTIYSDGSVSPNPGPGGVGAVLIYGQHVREISEPCGQATNNRAEILAACHALEALKRPCQVTLYSDSQYLINCARGVWERSTNLDLWERFEIQNQRHRIDWHWVRGHNGNSYNERADQLALEGRKRNP